jgi:hypothetical protein
MKNKLQSLPDYCSKHIKSLQNNNPNFTPLTNMPSVMSVSRPSMKISEAARECIREYLASSLTGGEDGITIFRRISAVNFVGEGKFVRYSAPSPRNPNGDAESEPEPHCEEVKDISKISAEDRKRYVKAQYQSFTAFTEGRDLRDGVEMLDGKQIFLHPRMFGQIDMSYNMTFKWSDEKILSKPVTPAVGDLVCIFLSNDTITGYPESGQKYPAADKWFVCSDQFMRAWTLLVHDHHESTIKMLTKVTSTNLLNAQAALDAASDEDDMQTLRAEYATAAAAAKKELRAKVFKGNSLMTNAWLKGKLCYTLNGLEFPEEESESLYWFLHSEFVSHRWVHVYAALVMIACFGELPCCANVPNTDSPDKPKMPSWDLPRDFVPQLIKAATGQDRLVTHDTIVNAGPWLAAIGDCGIFAFIDKATVLRAEVLDEIEAEKAALLPKVEDPEEFPAIDDKPVASWASLAAKGHKKVVSEEEAEKAAALAEEEAAKISEDAEEEFPAMDHAPVRLPSIKKESEKAAKIRIAKAEAEKAKAVVAAQKAPVKAEKLVKTEKVLADESVEGEEATDVAEPVTENGESTDAVDGFQTVSSRKVHKSKLVHPPRPVRTFTPLSRPATASAPAKPTSALYAGRFGNIPPAPSRAAPIVAKNAAPVVAKSTAQPVVAVARAPVKTAPVAAAPAKVAPATAPKRKIVVVDDEAAEDAEPASRQSIIPKMVGAPQVIKGPGGRKFTISLTFDFPTDE